MACEFSLVHTSPLSRNHFFLDDDVDSGGPVPLVLSRAKTSERPTDGVSDRRIIKQETVAYFHQGAGDENTVRRANAGPRVQLEKQSVWVLEKSEERSALRFTR